MFVLCLNNDNIERTLRAVSVRLLSRKINSQDGVKISYSYSCDTVVGA
jgi:hypothetical protein